MKFRYSFLLITFILFCSKLEAQQSCFDDAPCASGQFYIYYYDGDGDGYGNVNSTACLCSSNVPSNYTLQKGDCDDGNPNIGRPTAWYLDNDDDGYGAGIATMSCSAPSSNHVNNNDDCDDADASVGVAQTYYRDFDGDGFGNPNNTIEACSQPSGYVTNNNDCNDSDSTTTLLIFYADEDGDGYGDSDNTQLACTAPSGYVTNALDCNDSNSFINPNTDWYPDNDGDGFPSGEAVLSGNSVTQCEQPIGYVYYTSGRRDCDDNNAAINPLTQWYEDTNGDGIGDANGTVFIGCTPPSGYALEPSVPQPINEEPLPSLNGLNTQDMNMTYSVEPYQPVATLEDLDALANHKKVQSKSYYDGLGRPVQEVAMYAGGMTPDGIVQNIPSVSEWVYDWQEGSYTTPFYNRIGTNDENEIVLDETPFGDTGLLWRCGNDITSNADGGWNTDYLAVDKTVGYRYAVWVKRTINANNGRAYHGTQNVNNLDGTPNNNPYFFSSYLPEIDTWYLMVGVIHPSNYTGGDTGESGIYDINGHKVLDGREFKWRNDTSISRFRNYLYYATDTNVRQYFYNPVLQKMDGTELSMNSLLGISTGNDIINYIEYDRFGRTNKSYLPYGKLTEQSGDFQIDAKNEQADFYVQGNLENSFAQTSNPYSESVFERSPRARVMVQSSPDDNWQLGFGHEVTTGYDLNTSNEVRQYAVELDANLTPSLVFEGFYSSNELVKTVVRDENWAGGVNNTAEEFKNKDGLTILKRTYVDGTTLSTYYVYDDYNNLTYILPPKAEPHASIITQEVLDELCFQYRYDHLRRQIEKRNPGVGGWEKIVYDHEDRPILAQDANMEGTNEWLFTKYDKFGRVVYTGKYSSSQTRAQLQNIADNWVTVDELSHNEARNSATTIGGVALSYTNNAFPNASLEVLKVVYYDNYSIADPDLPSMPTSVLGQPVTTNTKGLATISWAKILGQNTWSKTYTFYDEKARAIRIHALNHHGGYTIVDSEIDFRGKVLRTVSSHKKDVANSLVSIEDRFKYDHMERLRTQHQKLYDGSTSNSAFSNKIVSGFVYDAVGQLMVKYIEPESETFGWHNAPVQSGNIVDGGSSNSIAFGDSFTRGDTGRWTPATKTSVVRVERQQLQIEANRQLDGALGYYNLSGNSSYIISFKLDKDKFNSDIQLRVAYKNETIYSSIITESGEYRISLDAPMDGTYTIGITRSSLSAMRSSLSATSSLLSATRSSQFFIIDNFLIQPISSSPPPEVLAMQLMDVNALQTIDYKYNARGSLTDINDISDMQDDLFAYKINYDTPTLAGGAMPMYNGNISEVQWRTKNDMVLRHYAYHYDALSRLKQANHTDSNYNLNSISYDKGGNILALNRTRGSTGTDDFSYTYDAGNKLIAISGTKTSSYTYDANGNMLTDSSKNITTAIVYNYLDLPELITFTNGDTIEYVYDAGGMKVQKIVTQSGVSIVTDYLDGFQYHQNQLQFFPQSEGYIAVNTNTSGQLSFEYVYNYTDHLGNVRLSYSDTNGNGSISTDEIVKENNYYPFGLLHQGYNNVVHPLASGYNYGFNGKELQQENGIAWLDFGSRNFDAELGRWMNIDPQAGRYHNISPFAAMGNNPITFTDPNGEELITTLIAGAVIGAWLGGATTAIAGGDMSDIGRNMLIGGLAGLASAGVASTLTGGTNAVISGTGFWNGAAVGGSTGFAGGLVSGSLASAFNGGDFGDILGGGLSGGFKGGISGAIIGGVSGGLDATLNEGDFWTGEGRVYELLATSKTSTKVGKGLEYSNKYAKEFSDKYFGKVDGLNKLYADGTFPKNYTVKGDKVFNSKGNQILAVTKPMGGKSYNVHLTKSVFSSKEQLYLTMQHEYLHVGLYYNGLKGGKKHHASIYDWQYKQAKAWKFRASYYKGRANAFSKFKDAAYDKYMPKILTKKPW